MKDIEESGFEGSSNNPKAQRPKYQVGPPALLTTISTQVNWPYNASLIKILERAGAQRLALIHLACLKMQV